MFSRAYPLASGKLHNLSLIGNSPLTGARAAKVPNVGIETALVRIVLAA
jgi:hypothetical protein